MIAYPRVIAKEWASYLIRANVICPAAKSELAQARYAHVTPEQVAETMAWCKTVIPLTGDMDSPQDSGNLDLFLASDISSYITGQLIGVDGGMMIGR